MAQQVIDQLEVSKPPLRMGHEEWWSWSDSRAKSEWVDGEVIEFMSATTRHGDLVGFFYVLLLAYVRFHQLGRVFTETLEMYVGGRGRVPDVLFIKTEHLGSLTEKRLLGPADLVIEVVSVDSVERDYTEKFAEYAAAGVAEYWILESRPGEAGMAFYRLVDGAYQQFFPDADGRLWSTVVKGFWFRPEWLTQDPLPNAWALAAVTSPDEARAALNLVSPA